MDIDKYEILEVKPQEFWDIKDIKTYLRISNNHDDILITDLLNAAIDSAEQFLGLYIFNRTILYTNIKSYKSILFLKYCPIIQVDYVKLVINEKEDKLDVSQYHLDNEKNTLCIKNMKYDIQQLSVQYYVGYNKSNIPHAIRQGILLHLAQMYDRENDECHLPNVIKNLYLPYKKFKI